MDNIAKEQLKRLMRSKKICIIVPTYNNSGTLHNVVSDVLNYSDDVIVVNDGSTDSTKDILKSFGTSIDVVSYPDNRGKGSALKMGFRRALESGYEYAITIDSDGQHYAENIQDFVRAICEYPGSLIVGARDLSKVDINGKSSFANKFSNFWFTVQTGRNLPDTQTGYRAYPLRKLYGLGLLTSRYEAELELLVFASWNGVDVRSIPIRVYYPPQSERITHFRPALDFTRISILNTILCIGAVVYGLPVRFFHYCKSKRIFSHDWKIFTHKNGVRKEAAVTLGRLVRSLYGLMFFIFWSMFVFTPATFADFVIGKPNERKRLRLHSRLQRISKYIVSHWPGGKTVYDNNVGETFDSPALIVCNHQSMLDLPLLMALHPKLIFLTNDWVWNSRFFGHVIHQAEFLPVSEGAEKIMPQLRNLVNRGYSIVVFPEGTRSADCSIGRFHQGAFLLAKELNVDILPMVMHGVGHYLPKKDLMFRKATVTLKILQRYTQKDLNDMILRKQASFFRKLIREELEKLSDSMETARYHSSNVLYKYAWRGWNIVARCKSVLSEIDKLSQEIDENYTGKVRILNSGMGVFAIWYALVNRQAEVYAYEESLADYKIALSTAKLPNNLHLIHSIMPLEENLDISFDKTYLLTGPTLTDKETYVISIPIKS